MRGPIRYAQSGDVSIAYQVTGDGPFDLVLVPGFTSHLEFDWEEPRHAAFLERLASFSRLIRWTSAVPASRTDTGELPTSRRGLTTCAR